MKKITQTLFNTVIILILMIFPTFIYNLTAQKTSDESSLLWEISGNELENPSFLFGTIHLIPKKEYFFTEKMSEKFNSCKTLVLEADIDMTISEQIELAKKMMLPEGKTLSDYMTNKQFKQFKTFVIDTLKIKKSKFKRMQKFKPILAITFILSELLEKPIAYEKKLSKKAKKNKMNFAYLETLEYQMSIFEKISIEEQIEMFSSEKMDKDILEKYMKLIEAYKNQDIEKLQLMFEEDKSLVEYEDDFLTKRNNNWIPKIEELLKKQSTFIAVGAGHLSGKNGLISLLKKKGYSVKPVK